MSEIKPVAWMRRDNFVERLSIGPDRPKNATSNPYEWEPLYPASALTSLREENERLKAEREQADQKLVDRYRDPKSGTFSFPGDVAAIVRRLDAAEARAEAAEQRVKEATDALKASSELINRLMHVHVAPDECTSYVDASRRWFMENGGSLAAIADQQAVNRAFIKEAGE